MKQTSKQHYNVFQNVGWMIGNAWRSCKSVLWMCVLAATLTVGVNLVQLFIAPQILSRVEQQAPLPELLGTIGVFSLALFLVLGLQAYVDQNTIFGRIEVRTGILNQIGYKTNTTSFSNTLDTAVLDLRDKANRAVQQNSMAGEHIWTTLTNLLANVAGFVLYLLLMQNLDPVLLAVVLATTLVSFLVTKRTNEWRYQHRDEEAKFFHQLRYLKDKSESVELAKDIRIFGLQPWLQGIYDSVLKLEEAFVYRYTKTACWAAALERAAQRCAQRHRLPLPHQHGAGGRSFRLAVPALLYRCQWLHQLDHRHPQREHDAAPREPRPLQCARVPQPRGAVPV